MSQAGDYGERRSEPWTYRDRVLPLRTYSGRVVYNRKRHFFKVEDAQRIISKLVPPDDSPGDTWAQNVINVLREATISMLDKVLPFLSSSQVEGLYTWCIDLLDKFFRVDDYGAESSTRLKAIQLITFIADRANVKISFPK